MEQREQAEAVARWCGWKVEVVHYGMHFSDARIIHDPSGEVASGLPPYADSLDAMREVEDEIERRGLQDSYAGWLCRVLFGDQEPGSEATWIVATATAAKRLEAAYMVVKEVESAGDR